MNTTGLGRQAESLAADYLAQRAYNILDRNWRTKYCEIDIIARKNAIVHFIEVKYRSNVLYGLPSMYIDAQKSHRLARAALAWCLTADYRGDYQIDLISISGDIEKPSIEILSSIISS